MSLPDLKSETCRFKFYVFVDDLFFKLKPKIVFLQTLSPLASSTSLRSLLYLQFYLLLEAVSHTALSLDFSLGALLLQTLSTFRSNLRFLRYTDLGRLGFESTLLARSSDFSRIKPCCTNKILAKKPNYWGHVYVHCKRSVHNPNAKLHAARYFGL